MVITTIQRLYSMLRGEADLSPEAEELGLEATQNLPPPGEIAREIVEDLRAALEQFESVGG